jgi:hypothetical protein
MFPRKVTFKSQARRKLKRTIYLYNVLSFLIWQRNDKNIQTLNRRVKVKGSKVWEAKMGSLEFNVCHEATV